MATQRFYKVQLTPAKIDDRGVVSFLLFDPGSKTYDITASTLHDMQAQVRALVADDFRKTAACYVRLANRAERKPAGFDKATREIQTIRYSEPSLAEIDAYIAKLAAAEAACPSE